MFDPTVLTSAEAVMLASAQKFILAAHQADWDADKTDERDHSAADTQDDKSRRLAEYLARSLQDRGLDIGVEVIIAFMHAEAILTLRDMRERSANAL